MNLEDERFKGLYEQNDFNLDPTHKDFKEESGRKIFQLKRSKKIIKKK